jgi:hypothetical protein
VYAKYMDWFSCIFNGLSELYHLARTLFTDGMHFMVCVANSCSCGNGWTNRPDQLLNDQLLNEGMR